MRGVEERKEAAAAHRKFQVVVCMGAGVGMDNVTHDLANSGVISSHYFMASATSPLVGISPHVCPPIVRAPARLLQRLPSVGCTAAMGGG